MIKREHGRRVPHRAHEARARRHTRPQCSQVSQQRCNVLLTFLLHDDGSAPKPPHALGQPRHRGGGLLFVRQMWHMQVMVRGMRG